MRYPRKTLGSLGALLVLLAGVIGFSSQASATLTLSAAVGGVPTGVSYVNFDNLPLGNTGGSSNGVQVTFAPDSRAIQGSLNGVAAPPYLSNNNGQAFGDSHNGQDATTYLTTGIGSITLTMPGQEKYLGLLWGSVDDFNALSFYLGNTLVGRIMGTDVSASAHGDQGVNGTYYVNILSTTAFDKVVASSTSYSFEFDNVAYNPTNPAVPEPATLALFGLGLGITGLLKRRNRK